MATTYISVSVFGASPLFTYTAPGDHLVITPGVTVGATSGTPLANLSLNDISLTVLGTLVSPGLLTISGTDAVVHIAAGGTFVTTQQSAGSAGFFLSGTLATLINDGSYSAPTTIGVLSFGLNEMVNTGTMLAASPIFIGLGGTAGDVFVNSGTVSANSYDDAGRDHRYNNAVMAEGGNTILANLAGGILTAVSSAGAGVRFNEAAGGSSLRNFGQISSLQDFGVNLGTVNLGQALIQVSNWGTISGGDGSYLGSVNADALTNRGLMAGDVDTGAGNDILDNRSGTVEGDVRLGGGDDTFDTRGGSVSGEIDGGAGNDLILSNTDVAEVLLGGDGTVDILDMRFGPGAIVALDGAFENAGSALGDVIGGFEYLFGSFAEADNLRGNGLGNFLFSFGGADVLDGAGGDDVLRGGTGQDTLTGGAGNDAFRFFTISEFGDVVTDFSSVGAGNNDHFQFSAAAIGGGLAVGILDAAFFQTRADNLAQDANDRFIFRTTDRTLWFDADGSGAGAARLVADLQASAIVANHDILILA